MSTSLRRLAAVVCLALAARPAGAGGDDSGALRMEVVTPRNVGYVIGDTITHVVRLELGRAYRLDASALPAAGRLDSWLELRAPELRRQGERIDIAFTYQLVSAPEATRELVVPRQTLYVIGAQRSVPLFVPEWSFTAGPIVAADRRGAAARFNLRPERLPPPLPLAPELWRLGALLGTWAGVMACIAWQRWGLPWRARRARPFAQALRRLEGMQREDWDDARRHEAFRVMHGALDCAAGCTLLPANVEELFRARPPLAAQRAPIAALLEDSRRLFFGTAVADPLPTLTTLVQLCRACRDIERGAA